MDSSCSSTPHAKILGNNSRATAGLWGHLLSKHGVSRTLPPSTASGSFIGKAHIPAIAPLDKAATSTRILLHDTQATLEKFSSHVEKLTNKVDDAKREIVMAHKVFHTGQEKMIEENVDLGMFLRAYTVVFLCHICVGCQSCALPQLLIWFLHYSKPMSNGD